MNDEEINFLKKLVEIYSPSGKEEKIAEFLKEEMKKLGFEVWNDPAGNVIGEIGSGKPLMLFSSHIDTVPGEIPVKIESGRLYGRGSVDAKGSIAAMILAISTLAKQDIKSKIIFVGLVEEEISLKGIDQLIKNQFKVDYAIFGEPAGSDRIGAAYKGRLGLKFTIKTKKGQGHVASSWLYINAIEESYLLWTELKTHLEQKYKGKSPFFSVIPNLTIIQGGTAVNVVPESCSMNIDIRFPPGVSSEILIKEMDLKIKEIIEKKEIEISYEILNRIEGYRADKKSKIFQTTINAISEVLNKKPKVLRKTGTCFMNIIGKKMQIPIISYGPGDPQVEHTDNEYIELEDFLNSIKVYKKIIKLLLEVKN
ncbi:MAG: M20/M25/M40 family metallo-hydrolase [Candidatus Helarchaeota archaeon]|nr:M20/M25/M40 family metallo-hydrolase [Candidatus Helarchaeota archaeon]